MEQQVSPGGDAAPADADIAVVTTGNTGNFNSVSQAARALAQVRHRRPPERSSADAGGPREGGDMAATTEPTTESAAHPRSTAGTGADDAASPETEVRGETESADPAAATPPPIEPPRSWTKEDKELFRGLPRATQERLAERERSRESDVLRHQNEAAERLKGLTAREQAMDVARQKYEAALVNALQLVQAQHTDEFADIKTTVDVERLAKDDLPRYVKWSEQQRQLNAIVEQVRAAQERAALEAQQKWSEFSAREDALLIEHVSEMADPAKAVQTHERAIAMFKEIGFSEQEIGQWWAGGTRVPLRDHRLQRVVLDAIRYREAQQKAKQAAARPLPPVQRPGTAEPRGAAANAQIEALSKRLEASGSLKDAAALIAARRKAGQ